MNINRYLVSPDITARCGKIGHSFSPLEMVAIIAHSDKLTMAERHELWREIITYYPDMPIPGSENFNAKDSLHEYLNCLIALEERILSDFLKPQDGYIYQFTACWNGVEGKSIEGIDSFSTYSKAWAAFCERWDWAKDDVTYAAFSKSKIDTRDRISVSINSKQEILGVYSYFSNNPDYRSIDILTNFYSFPRPSNSLAF